MTALGSAFNCMYTGQMYQTLSGDEPGDQRTTRQLNDDVWYSKRDADDLAERPVRASPALAANYGHLPDGSSVQKHSAGELYPYVLAFVDRKFNGSAGARVRDIMSSKPMGLYSVYILGPDLPDRGVFVEDYNRAVHIATILKLARNTREKAKRPAPPSHHQPQPRSYP